MSDKIHGFQPSYSSFLATSYHNLSELWLSRDLRSFWRGIKGFTTFLPVEIKEKIEPTINEVDAGCHKVENQALQGSYTWIDGQSNRNKAARRYLANHSLDVLDKIMRLLDERGYLEKVGTRLKPGSFKEFEDGKEK